MLSKFSCATGAALAFAFVAGSAAQAAPPPTTLTITINGTLGPVLSGSDTLGLNGKSAVVTVLENEAAKPIKHTTTSATYKVPAGAITVNVNGSNYQSSSPAKMTINIKSSTLTLVAAVTVQGLTITFVDTTALAANSWTKAALMHPTVFTPSPQDITEPTSKLKYSYVGGSATLGVTGTASSSDALDVRLPDDGE